MPLEDRHIWMKPRGPTWFRKIIDDIYEEITLVQPIPGLNAEVSQTSNGRQINASGGAGGGPGADEDNNHYEFEAIDFSDEEGAKVLIYDGLVYGPNDDGQMPDGMTGGDDYVAGPFSSDAEVWLEIWVNFDSWNITSININWGSETPEDNDSTIFVTICFVGVEYPSDPPFISFVRDISNAICGDYVVNPGVSVTGNDPDGVNFEMDHVTQINFLGAVTTHHDPSDPNPTAVDIFCGADVQDDVYGAVGGVDNCELITFTHAIPDDENQIVQNNGGGEALVHLLKLDVIDGEGGAVSAAHQLTFLNLPTPDGEHRVQPGAIWGECLIYNPTSSLGMVDVQGSDGSYVSSVGLITFKVAADPSANYMTVYNGTGFPGINEAVVEIPLIPESIGGFAVLADDSGDTHWQGTVECPCEGAGPAQVQNLPAINAGGPASPFSPGGGSFGGAGAGSEW